MYTRFICNLCIMAVMVKEADLDWIEVPDDCEVLDAAEDYDAVPSGLL